MDCERRKTHCRKKKYLGGMFSYFINEKNVKIFNMQKMSGFLDEKYTPGNMKNMHAGVTNILVKHAI
jgi:hypothetical protein